MGNCSNSCSNNTLIINRPSTSAGGACSANACNTSISPNDPLDKGQLGPRRKREQVREQIKDAVIMRLGAPAITLELDQQQLDWAVDYALKIFENYAPREFFNYYVFTTVPGKSIYSMPPEIGYVRNVFYKKSATFAFQASDLDGAIPIEYFYPGGAYSSIQGGLIDPIQPIWGRMGEWHLYKQYEMTYSRLSSNLGGWEWLGDYGTIKLYPIPVAQYKVIVHYIQKSKDWPEATQAMIEGAFAYAKEIVGYIRRRIKNPPGPNGGIQLDGAEMVAEALEAQKKWEADLLVKYGDILPITLD